jgi:tetratricopeptide (TPR) repeat protein
MALHLLLAPMLLGGVLPWTMVLVAVMALAALGTAAYAFSGSLSDPSPAVLWAALGLLGWTSLQALRIPCDLVAMLAPESANSARAAQAALGASSGVCTLSRDLGATLAEIVKGIAIVATLAGAWLFGANGSRRAVLWMIAASSLAMSVVALGHGLARLDQVFGVYKPVETGGQLLLAPLMNPNNLGAFAALGVPLWIGLTYRTGLREVRWLGRVAVVITALTAILSLSRGAIGQLGLEALLVVVCIRMTTRSASRRPEAHAWRRNLAIAIAVVAGCGLAMYVAGQLVTAELANHDISKLQLLQRSLAFAARHAWVGVGRGAFSSAFVGVEGQTVRFAYPENFLIQWASEWGFPITLSWLALLAVALIRAARQSKSIAHLCGFAALLAYSAQNLLDLGFELVGIAVVAAALLGATIAPRKRDKTLAPSPATLLFSVGSILVAGLLILGTLAPPLSAQAITALDARLREQMRVQDRNGFRRTLARALTLHPAEPVFAVLAASEALEHNDRSSGLWINQAMRLAPRWGAPHVLAFQWLWRVGQRDQALVELRQAAETDPRPWKAQICTLVGRKDSPVLLAAPRGAWRATYLEMAASCVEPAHPAAKEIDDVLIREFPDQPLAFERAAYRLSLVGEVDEGLEAINALLARQPNNPRARARRAEMLVAAGRAQETVEQVDRDLPLAPTLYKLWLLRSQGKAYAQLGDAAGAHRVVVAYRSLSSNSVEGLADSYAFEATVQLGLQNMNTALAAYREAYNIDPQTPYLWQVADLAGRLGDRAQLVWAYVQLCAREPLTGSYCATRDQILAPRLRDVR